MPGRTMIALALLLLPAAGRAQTTVSMLDRFLTGASAQLQVPSIDGPLKALLVDFGARVPLGPHTNLMVELPIIRATGPGPIAGDLEAVRVANPYLGLRIFSEHHLVDVGIRLPLLDGDDFEDAMASVAGVFADWDRFEAWLPDYVPVRVQYTGFVGRPRLADGMSTRIIAGPTVLIPSDGGDIEALGNYGIAVSHSTARREIQAAFTGAIELTGDGNFGERTVHQLSLGATLRTTGVRPTAFIRVPLDSPVSEALDFVLGFGIVADLR